MGGLRVAATLRVERMIIVLRDPVERAYSAFTHESARGFEDQPYERALALEEARLAGEEERLIADPTYVSFHHQHHAYVGRGRYADQLERLGGGGGRQRAPGQYRGARLA